MLPLLRYKHFNRAISIHGPGGILPPLLLDAQQLCGRIRVKLLDGFELAGDGAAAGADEFFQVRAGLVQVTAPRIVQTSPLRFWMASVRKPICRALSSAAMVDGPATVIW